MARGDNRETQHKDEGLRRQDATPEDVARALKRGGSRPRKAQDAGMSPPVGNRDAFEALLRRAVPPDEANSPEGETSDPAST